MDAKNKEISKLKNKYTVILCSHVFILYFYFFHTFIYIYREEWLGKEGKVKQLSGTEDDRLLRQHGDNKTIANVANRYE